jgi:hypothetical protein
MVTRTLHMPRAWCPLLVGVLLCVGLCGCGSSSIDDAGGSLSIGESGTYPYWLVMQGCSDNAGLACSLGLSNGSTTLAITAPPAVIVGAGVQASGAGGTVYISAGSWTGVSGVTMDEYPPSNAGNYDQPCTGSPSSLGSGEWFCPLGEGEWSFVVGPLGGAAPETQPAWAVGSS